MNHSASRHPLIAAMRNAAAFLLALAAGCAAICAGLPSLYVGGLSEKLEHLRAHRGKFDTIYIGSSRVYHAFDPAEFDRATGSTHSFNFGIDGMRPPESFYVLREVLKLRLPLRHVFIELSDFQSKINSANVGSARYVHWHDCRHTAQVLRHIAAAPMPAGERAAQALVHAGCFLRRLSNLGRGPELLAAKMRGSRSPRSLPVSWKDRAGFEVQSTPPAMAGEARVRFESAVSFLQKNGMARTTVPPLLAGALREVLAELHAAGAQPVLVISPTIVGRENLVGLTEAGIDAPVIAFTDPNRYPAIFRAENHCDEQHVNAAGAAEFTRALATEWAAVR
jgi:hypothetical protein